MGTPVLRPRAAPAEVQAPVRLLLVNDLYVLDTLRDGSGGLARLAAWRDSVENAHGEQVLFVMAGDLFSPSLLSKWYEGRQMVEASNAARFDYATLGNHEFDVSRDAFVARINESRFQWLSANCGFGDGTPFPNVRGWDTLTVNGTRVGVYGTTLVAEYRSWVRCTDPQVAGTAAVDTLESLGVEFIVGLTHVTIGQDSAALVRETRVPLILGGHEHDGRRIEHEGRLLRKAASNARTAVYVEARRGPEDRWVLADTALRPGRGWTESPAVAAVASAWRDTLSRRIGPDEALGTTAEPIDVVDSTSRRAESRFGNFVTDAMRDGTQAEVALINAGAMRLDDVIDAGPVTAHTLESAFLFADETRAITFPLTGARLREVLEHGVSRGRLGSGAHLQVSGVSFRFDPSRESGSRLDGPLRRPNGSVIAPDDTLRVTFVVYPTCLGGDGYNIPEAREACAAAEANPQALPRTAGLVVDYARKMGGSIVLPPLGRVSRPDRPAPSP